MTKKLFILCAALVWTVSLMAQKISVVSPEGDTKLYKTLQEAIEGAAPESVIYLPGGSFTIGVKIAKKLTIIGIGHTAKNDNVDGITLINGSLQFYEGSSGSAVMGCYITGSIGIGSDYNTVNDMLIKYCHVGSVIFGNSDCTGTIINQNYIGGVSNDDDSFYDRVAAEITNNVVGRIAYIDLGVISNNIVIGGTYSLYYVENSVVTNNIFLRSDTSSDISSEGATGDYNNTYDGNIGWGPLPQDGNYTDMSSLDKNDVFVKYNGGNISPNSNFHFKEDYAQYEGKVGIYHGTFNDKQLVPVPYIVDKRVDDHTDASGKLNIKIRVKASGEE